MGTVRMYGGDGLADLDGDGHPDLATASDNWGDVSVLWNDGAGSFEPQAIWKVDGNLEGIAAGDVDRDGAMDLVVADESTGAIHVLRNMGHEVCAVTAYGEDAVEKAVELRPELILMDIRLRGTMSGFEAAEKIREHLDVPVVYLTAFTDDETLARAKVTQPFGYLQKPFRSRELHSAIDIAIYRHDMERQLRQREQSYRLLADNLPGILYRHSLVDERTQLFNTMHEVITGYTVEELTVGSRCSVATIMVPEDREPVARGQVVVSWLHHNCFARYQ